MKQEMANLQSSLSLPSEAHYICRAQIKEVVTPPNIIKALESDFNEKAAEDSRISQEDPCLVSKMKTGIRHKADGHYEMPNQICRTIKVVQMLKRGEKYYSDLTNETIARGDAEKVPAEETDKLPAWYIPHDGVYHP